MLTRLEVDGFKNLLDFACDFGPYTCIAGPNAVGKSNVFDAIEFLALLADNPFLDAAQRLRTRDKQPSDPKSLFWNSGQSPNPVISLAAEMIVPADVLDDFGRPAKPTSTFLRYELALRYDAPGEDSPHAGGIRLVSERLSYKPKREAGALLAWPHSPRLFRDEVIRSGRRNRAYISMTEQDGEPVVLIHQEAGSRGKPLSSNPARAQRTVVSTTTSSANPTILAARREMSRWHQLALEPSAMRAPDGVDSPGHVTQDGAHMAAALYRMAREQGDDAYAAISAEAAQPIRLTALTGTWRQQRLGLRAVPVEYLIDYDLDQIEELFSRGDD